MNTSKKVIVITYYFPPCGGGPVIRTYKYVKYLREFGWEPIILTVKHHYYAFKDESIVDELPDDLKIYYTRPPLIQRIIRYAQNKGSQTGKNIEHTSNSNVNENKLYLRLKTLKNKLNRIFYIYDDYEGWIDLALKKIEQIIREQSIDLIYTTSQPHSLQRIGSAIYKKYGIPWIADFRDPWTQDQRYYRPPTFIHRIITQRAERETVAHAHKVISVSSAMTDFFRKKYKHFNAQKFITITNGYDSQNFKTYGKEQKYSNKFVITYSGTFYLHQTPIWFYRAVKIFLEKNPNAREKLIIQLVGKSQKNYEAYPYKIGIGDVIKSVGYVPYKEVNRYLFNSDLLLLIIWSDPKIYDFVYTGKLFEYLPVGKPIMALANQGVGADLINDLEIGKVIAFNDVGQIVNAISDFYHQWLKGQIVYKPLSKEKLAQFERKNLTKKLAAVFDEVLATAL